MGVDWGDYSVGKSRRVWGDAGNYRPSQVVVAEGGEDDGSDREIARRGFDDSARGGGDRGEFPGGHGCAPRAAVREAKWGRYEVPRTFGG